MLTKDFLQKNSLLILLVCAFVIRLYGFSNPIADWHSWRQADTSAVSRNFVKQGYDILHPRFDDLSNVASGKDNPLGYRFVEFPLYNLLQALTYQIIGVFTLEQWGRLVTIFSSLASISCIYLLVKKYASTRAGFLAALFYAVLPYNIYYGRVILPDPSMVAASLLCLYFFDRWISAKNPRLDHWFFLTVLSGASALEAICCIFSLTGSDQCFPKVSPKESHPVEALVDGPWNYHSSYLVEAVDDSVS